MNYTEILTALNQASLFDLYRLHAAIGDQLNDPQRQAQVKRALRPGQALRWFNADENRLVTGRLLRINRTRAVVRGDEDGHDWTIPFFLIDLEGADTEIAPQTRQGLDRHSVKVGDRVAFRDREGRERFGEVLKRNPKTATVVVHGRIGDQILPTQWRVAYPLLSPVLDGEVGSGALTPHAGWSGAADRQDTRAPVQAALFDEPMSGTGQ